MEVEQSDSYATSGLDAVRFNIVRKPEDFENAATSFPPDMCHQIFSERESIFGYTNLKVRICYAAASMNCHVDITYDSKIPKDKHNLKPDNIVELLEEWLPPSYTTSKEKFLEVLAAEDPSVAYGKTIASTECKINGQSRSFVLNHCSLDEPGFKEFHSRFETWIVWFIDAASCIDMADPRWLIYVLYEKIQDPDVGTKHFPVGYCTLYKYYAFPEHIRPRISQFIVLPPFQKAGLGTFMLKAVYEAMWKMPMVKDITVEDPSENFRKLRDYLDAMYVRKELPSFSDKSLLEGFRSCMRDEAKQRFKINARQARRIYEILKLARVKKSGKGLNEYKAELMHRVEAPLRKHEAKLKKLAEVCKTNGLMADMDVRHKHAEAEINQLMEAYEPVVERLLKEVE